MNIIIGKTAGFCYGVKRAVDGAKNEVQIAKNNNEEICCLGEIVHNKQVVELLENSGLQFVDTIQDSKGKMLIRAHGVPKEIYEKAEKNNIDVIDFTCQKVLKIHEIAHKYAKDGYYIFLCGSKNHPENIGTISYCGKHIYVIEKEEDLKEALKNFEKSKIKKLLLISQTTFSLEKFENIQKEIKEKILTDVLLEIKNTICMATKLRQEETKEIAEKVQYMIIIGGKNSSNTKKLYEIAKKYCKNSISIETEEELHIDNIKQYETIGIMAGASTPQWTIKNVEKILKELDKNKVLSLI